MRVTYLVIAGIVAGLFLVLWGPSVQFGDPLAKASASFEEIKTLQDEYFVKKGEYLHVIDGKLPEGKEGTVKGELGSDIPLNVSIESYVTPDGQKGYQVREKTEGQVRSENVGPVGESWRTYTHDISTPTSTIDILEPLGSIFSFAYPLAEALTANTHAASTTRASSQYFSIADASQTGLDGGAAMTFCTWFRFGTYNTAGDHHTLVGKGSATGGTRQFRWNVRGDGGGGNTLWVFQASSAGSSFDGDTVALDSGLLSVMTWYHACAVFDGANTDTLYYRNGAQISTTQNNGISALNNGSSPFSVGAENVGVTPAEFFNGQIDDLRVWTRVLSAAEISNLYTDPCNFDNGLSLSAHWTFDNTALDETANNNDLTASGGATFSTAHAFECAAAGPVLGEDTFETIWFR